MQKKICLFVFFLITSIGVAFAFTVPSAPANYVNDYAHLLSPSVQADLNQKLFDFEKQTSNQIIVATVPSLDGQPIEDYSIKLAEKWKIGSHLHNNGVILLISKAEHEIRIEVGYGLEGALPDAIANEIISNDITPAFKEGDFDKGVEQGIISIMQATQHEYKANATNTSSSSDGSNFISFIVFIIFIWIIFKMRSNASNRVHSGFWSMLATSMILSNSSNSSSGGSFGGFGGGGGGSFGGGGASGRW